MGLGVFRTMWLRKKASTAAATAPFPMPLAYAPQSADPVAIALILFGALLCAVLASSHRKLHAVSARSFQVIGMAVNIVSVSLPGRFDGDANVLLQSPWPTLFSPAGFAFAIWGVIYLGELAGIAAIIWSSEDEWKDRSSQAWLSANLAQTLWCLCFRPWALGQLWLSSVCLATTAYCLFRSQCFLASEPGSTRETRVVGWPRSIHLGWVTAATLVNVNAWAGLSNIGPAAALAAVVLSIVAATWLANVYASSGLPAASLAIAWALFAVGEGMPIGQDAVSLGALTMHGLAMASQGAAAWVLIGLAVRAMRRVLVGAW